MFRKILHPTDFTEVAMRAFEQAVVLARRYNAELRVVHAITLNQYNPAVARRGMPMLDEIYDSIEKELSDELVDMGEKSKTNEVPFEWVFHRGINASEAIMGEAEDWSADLIIMGTHGNAKLRHFFLGSVAEQVVRYSPCPVMVLGREEDIPGKFENILLPVDFSATSDAAAEVAMDLARVHGATVHTLHVFESPAPPPYFYTEEDIFSWDPRLKERAEKALREFAHKHNEAGLTTVTHVEEGRPSRKIVSLAQKIPIDLIVMGTKGVSGIDHLLLGSVTEKVLRKAQAPVLTVRVPSKVK